MAAEPIEDAGVTNAPVGLTNVIALSSAAGFALALKADGTAVGWGDDTFGQTDVPAGLTNLVAISAGTLHGLGLKADGTVVAWGNPRGNLNEFSNVVAIAAGHFNSLALRADGTVLTTEWHAGGGAGGILGAWTGMPSSLTNVVSIAAGDNQNWAIRADGSIAAWGSYLNWADFFGLALSDRISAVLTNAEAVTCSGNSALVLGRDGSVSSVSWSESDPVPVTPVLHQKLDALTNVIEIAFNVALIDDARPAQRTVIVSPTRASDAFQCSILTQSGRVYRLEFKESLGDSEWKARPLVAGSGGMVVLEDANPASSHRFYRVCQW